MQKLQCSTCAEPPGSHIYYYAHHSKQLTIQVKRISIEKWLPGESEGKLWMWSRCCKCKTGKKKSTKRVLISTAAHSLSFGKFLELSFSHHSSSNRLSSCGHTLHRDFLYFFGYNHFPKIEFLLVQSLMGWSSFDRSTLLLSMFEMQCYMHDSLAWNMFSAIDIPLFEAGLSVVTCPYDLYGRKENAFCTFGF